MSRLRCGLASVVAVALLAPSTAAAAVRTITPAGPSLESAYGASGDGDAIELTGGDYPSQTLPAGSKAVVVRAAAGQVPDLAGLTSAASNVTVQGLKMRRLEISGGSSSVYEGLDIDGRFAKQLALEHSGGTGITLRNSRVGNVTDEKGAIIGESRFTLDNVTFHDVLVTDPSVHNECVYATGAEGLTVRNSRFYNCATMDLFFTNYAGGPDYGNVTLENNVFEHSMTEIPGEWHYYSLFVGQTGPGGAMTNWVVRNNTFEIDASISSASTSGSRWVGNLGGWTCVPGVAYRFNVGARCGSTDKAVSPDSSTRTSTAPFGWLDPPGHNFRLRAGSPAIDAADPSDAPATDRDGYLRDARPDAGAYEFGAGPPPGGGAGGGGGGAGSPVAQPPPGTRGAVRIRRARLRPRTICKHSRRHCRRVAKLRVTLTSPAKVRVSIRRVGAKHRARLMSRRVRTSRTMRIRSHGLRRGRYRVRVRAGAQTRTVRLRVKR